MKSSLAGILLGIVLLAPASASAAPSLRLLHPAQDEFAQEGFDDLPAQIHFEILVNGLVGRGTIELFVDGTRAVGPEEFSITGDGWKFSSSVATEKLAEGRHTLSARLSSVQGNAEAAVRFQVRPLRPLSIPEVPRVGPPSSLDPAVKKWLVGWGQYVGGKMPKKPSACSVRWGDEPFCRQQVAGKWYRYDLQGFYRLAEAVYWQLAARGEIRPPAQREGPANAARADFVYSEGPTTYVLNVARATLLRHNNLPAEGAVAPLTIFVRDWSAGGAVSAGASQAEILRSRAFEAALQRQFSQQFPEYARYLSLPLSRWPAEALRAREGLIPELYSWLTSRHLDEGGYLAWVEAEKAAGRLPRDFRSSRESRVRGTHGECRPNGPCQVRSASLPNSPMLLCMDVGNDGRFEFWPAEQQPPCAEITRGEVAVFAPSCGWQPAVCVGAGGVAWKFLGEIRDNPQIPAEVVAQLETALDRHGYRLPPKSANTEVAAVPRRRQEPELTKAFAADQFQSLFAALPQDVALRLLRQCEERDVCEPVAACLAANAYDACARVCAANARCAGLELFPPKPTFELSPRQVAHGGARDVFVGHARPNSKVAIWCQAPDGSERCSGWEPGSTDARGEFKQRGNVTPEYAPGRWCGYAVVDGQRSNVDCYDVVERGDASTGPRFELSPSRVVHGQTRDVIVTNAAPNAEVRVWCQDPDGRERCSGWVPGTTDEGGSLRSSGAVSRDYAPGRWCGYAIVDGRRSNVDCYTVETAPRGGEARGD